MEIPKELLEILNNYKILLDKLDKIEMIQKSINK